MYIESYNSARQSEWDDFVARSRNATFILSRRFMDYHSDRFPDESLMLYDGRGRLLALLPATGRGTVVSSHAGLTYGGWILGKSKPNVVQLLEGWKLMSEYFVSRGYDTLIYKPVPHIYHSYPSDEDLYVLFRHNAVIEASYVSSVIDLSSPLSFNVGTRRHVKRGFRLGLSISRSDDYAGFWSILSERLQERYGAVPVHSLEEIRLLYERFPENIRLWVVRDASGEMLAGTVLFVCGRVVKAQYIASSVSGREVNAVDFLFNHLIGVAVADGYSFFDLGHSCEDGGRSINFGLISQKCGYGGRAMVHSTYKISLVD